jgi:hypothetical protein
MSKPAEPADEAGESGQGETCGPIVNKKCRKGLCCSGYNFCGGGEDFCGAANWCQSKWEDAIRSSLAIREGHKNQQSRKKKDDVKMETKVTVCTTWNHSMLINTI